MSLAQTMLLGFIAGATIFLGLPVGRIRRAAPRTKAFLNAASAGILLFLVFETFHDASDPVEEAANRLHEGQSAWGSLVGYGAVRFAGIALGLLSLLYLGGPQRRGRGPPQIGPGPMAM